MKIKHNFIQLLLAIDQLFNVFIFMIIKPKEASWADESLSSHCHRLSTENGINWPKKIVNAIFFWQDDHCKEAYESEINRTQCPPQMRKIEE